MHVISGPKVHDELASGRTEQELITLRTTSMRQKSTVLRFDRCAVKRVRFEKVPDLGPKIASVKPGYTSCKEFRLKITSFCVKPRNVERTVRGQSDLASTPEERYARFLRGSGRLRRRRPRRGAVLSVGRIWVHFCRAESARLLTLI